MIDLSTLTISKARKDMQGGSYTALDLVKAYLKVIEEKNQNLNVYLEVFEDVLDQAKEYDKKSREEKEKLPLGGIPIALKDNILIKDKIATGGSKILEGYVAPYDATVTKKLKEAGAIFIGRTNMDEFAMGGSTENSTYGVTKNPYDESRVAGGSSGGSAAAVAMDGTLAALGSDTGGSIRQPASYCGVVGLKPTYGYVSRYGLMAMASSLDVIGPMTKTVEDAQIIFNVIKGQDKNDATSREKLKEEESNEKNSGMKNKKIIGVPRSSFSKGVDPDVMKIFDESLEKLETLGFNIKEIELPLLQYGLSVYYVLMPAEVSSNLSRYDGVKYGKALAGDTLLQTYMNTRGNLFGREARRRIMLGTYVLSSGYYDAYYSKAIALRDEIKKDFIKIFEEVDLIATPVAPTPAFKIGQNSNDPLKMYLEDIFTVGANLSGIPAISIPAAKVLRGEKLLPVGLQLMAKEFNENLLFDVGKEFEQSVINIV